MSVLRGDCCEVMAGMSADSVDALVTDPPYGLEFMGKEWDRLGPNAARWEGRRSLTDGIAPVRDPETPGGRHAARVAAPSPNLRCTLCGHYKFSGTPCRCPAPSWEARGNEHALRMEAWHARWATAALRVAKPGAYLLAFGGTRTVHRMTCALEDAGWVIRDMLIWGYASGFPKSRASLKPAYEPIVLARKPGASRDLRIDECRIGTSKDVPASVSQQKPQAQVYGKFGIETGDEDGHNPNIGRWPANLVLTDPILDGGWEGVVGGGETGPGAFPGEYRRQDREQYRMGSTGEKRPTDSGTYSRFFMVPKAPRKERILSDGRRSPHPTQKPEALIRHLVNLVTPTGGTVLDPFLGSGTLGVVCEGLGVQWVGIEREPEYADWAEARIRDGQPEWSAA